jgi:transglutaminase-like putative cysteine protease
MDRRELLKAGVAISAAAALPAAARAQAAFSPKPGAWRSFDVVTRLEIARPEGRTQAWVPVPSVDEAAWFRSRDSSFTTNGKGALVRDTKYGAGMVHVEWAASEAAPFVEVTSRVATRDRAVDLASPTPPTPLPEAARSLYTEGTELIPVDGIVKATADRITVKAVSDLDKARAIYDWIVENTYRDARTRGCGIGDIAAMLKTGNLGGKCADLNALYVGLARAAGLPARDLYGIRIAPSAFGYKSLGAGSEVITKAQHCRAEVWLEAFGWVPVDPADVRKVMLEEPPTNLGIDDPKVAAARKALFGAWETNWLAYNVAHDLALPGASGPKVGFLMYPQAETASQRLDCLDPDTFRYVIRAKETTAA